MITHWEYQVFLAKEPKELFETLNEAGKDGWELVSASQVSGEMEENEMALGETIQTMGGRPRWVAFLKRERQPEQLPLPHG